MVSSYSDKWAVGAWGKRKWGPGLMVLSEAIQGSWPRGSAAVKRTHPYRGVGNRAHTDTNI